MSASRTFGMGTGSSDSGVSSSMFLRRIDRSATARSGGKARVSVHPLLWVLYVQPFDNYVPTLMRQLSELTRMSISGSPDIFSRGNGRVRCGAVLFGLCGAAVSTGKDEKFQDESNADR